VCSPECWLKECRALEALGIAFIADPASASGYRDVRDFLLPSVVRAIDAAVAPAHGPADGAGPAVTVQRTHADVCGAGVTDAAVPSPADGPAAKVQRTHADVCDAGVTDDAVPSPAAVNDVLLGPRSAGTPPCHSDAFVEHAADPSACAYVPGTQAAVVQVASASTPGECGLEASAFVTPPSRGVVELEKCMSNTVEGAAPFRSRFKLRRSSVAESGASAH
jgi:hypothetical protein